MMVERCTSELSIGMEAWHGSWAAWKQLGYAYKQKRCVGDVQSKFLLMLCTVRKVMHGAGRRRIWD